MPNDIAVSSWALHRTLERSYPDSPGVPRLEATEGVRHGEGALAIEDLPQALADRGYRTLQLCHFHLPRRASGYLEELRGRISDAGIELHALLIDEGDITDPEHGARDAAWIAAWLETAERLGAQNARVIAGKQMATAQTLALAADRLSALVDGSSVRIITENWFELTSTPESVNSLLDAMGGRLGLCADFGNWPRPRKYDDLPKIMGRAEVCHAKLEFLSPETLDLEDGAACVKIAQEADFTGPYVLVNGGTGASDWDGLEVQRDYLNR